jgi:hypothetical protein
MDATQDLLDGVLQRWHASCKSEGLTPERTVCASFRRTPTPRAEQFEHELAEESIEDAQLQAIQFHVDQLSPEHRTALQFEARNLNARVKVWRSPRLPVDPKARESLIREAREALAGRLKADGRVF